MKSVTLVIAVLLIVSSCGMFKKTTLKKASTLQNSESKREYGRDSSLVLHDRSVYSSDRQQVDRSRITTMEKVEEPVNVRGFETRLSVPLDLGTLYRGITVVKDNNIEVSHLLDSASNTLQTNISVKDKQILAPIHKQTIEERDVTSVNNNEDRKNIGKKLAVNVREKEASEAKIQAKYSEQAKEPAKMGVWLGAVAIVLVTVFGWLLLRKPGL
ncbi:hypothetical protein [Mucilaginibacter hurinus]|nr:hypothetical protein [Mucilaginibacter hurinus]